MTILIDFDGTCVTHEFPFIGKDIGAQKVLKQLVDKGHKLILFTMRSDKIDVDLAVDKIKEYDIHLKTDQYLTQAVEWFEANDIPLFGIQADPNQHTWTSSPKAYGQLIIDDTGLGCPLSFNKYLSARPFVDWAKIETLLKEQGIL